MPMTERIDAWRRRGAVEEFRGRRIHVLRRSGRGPRLLLLHGFPSSSYDWRGLLETEAERGALAFDFLGFGLSEKPRDHEYSLMWQADLAEELVRRDVDGRVFVVAHDMGTSVATELMARDLEGRLEMEIAGALLFNGSILLHLASPTVGQKLLRSPFGPLFSRLSSERFFRRQFASLFSREHPLTDQEAADQWALLSYGGGRSIAHKLVHYMDERERLTERWHGAFRDWPGPLHLAWGMRDPVATPRVLDGLRQLRPDAPVTELPGAGHYPQIEAPEEFARVLEVALADPRPANPPSPSPGQTRR
jgi:pimeloyl-ACP methyl ester carboxylesterase